VKGDQGAVSSDQELVTSDQGLETGDDGLPVISQKSPVTFTMEDVWLNAGGHTILKEINLSVAAGEHLAIVGPSGAGKSSLVGLLLGWARPVQGSILVDGASLDGSKISQLRQETAWVDPAVQLWNRSLYENLRYGGEGVDGREVGAVVQQADLYGVLERMPDGLKSVLGESGGLVSGGEGQRVRLGRAMMRPVVRLVILDEPFRGLDREQRRDLLAGAREYWKDATLLCITHDMKETLAFSRVLVIEEGKIMEDGNPQDLAARDGTRYRALLDAEEEVREGLWQSAEWRRLWIEDGRLKES
jgi:ATP-binding cassette subfamily B protein